MKRRTTTKKINDAITNNLVKLTKAKVYHKATRKTEPIVNDTLIENLQLLSESDVFASCIGWTYEKNYKTNGYIAKCGRTEGNAENIITLYLSAGDGVSNEDIEKALVKEETEE